MYTEDQHSQYKIACEQSGCVPNNTMPSCTTMAQAKATQLCSQDFTSVAVYYVVYRWKFQSERQFMGSLLSLDPGSPTTVIKVNNYAITQEQSLSSKIQPTDSYHKSIIQLQLSFTNYSSAVAEIQVPINKITDRNTHTHTHTHTTTIIMSQGTAPLRHNE